MEACREAPHGARVNSAHPAAVHDRLSLAVELGALREEKGLSFREIERLSKDLVRREKERRAAGQRATEGAASIRFVELPRSTVSDFVRDGNLNLKQFDTFVEVCGASRDERAEWAAAWRQATDRSPTTTIIGTIPREVACFRSRAAASRLPRTGRHRGGHYVVTGLGGVGKTQLAASFAQSMITSRGAYVVVWTSASSRAAIIGRYALAAKTLKLRGAGDGDERASVAFLSWCASTSRPWVIVLDDLSSPAAVKELWPPVTPTGQVLVTTRRRDGTLLDGRMPIHVDVFTADEACGYLGARLSASSADDVDGVANDLGFLPLALSHASAYMVESGITCSEYRRIFADEFRRLQDLFPEEKESFDPHAATIATTWKVSLDQADGFAPAGIARPLIDLASFLDPSAVPVTVLTTPATLHYLARRRHAGQQDVPDADEYELVSVHEAQRGRSNLRRLNLIDEESHTIRIHALVQRAVRERMTDEEADLTARAAADALLECWPQVEKDPELAAALRANTTSLRERRVAALTTGAIHPVLFRAAESLADVGQHQTAIDTTVALLADAEARLGAEARDTLSLRNSLADLRGQAGDPAAAIALLDDLLPDLRRNLGADHPDTLAARYNRAHWLGQTGRPGEAAAAAEGLLADRLRLANPDDRDTLASRDQVMRWRGAAGNVQGALEEARELLNDQIRVLGPDHQDTLTTRNNLATWLGESGDAAGAATEFAQLVIDRTRVLGPDHPHTLVARNNELYWRGLSGDAAGAAAGYAAFFADIERVLGPRHVNTLATRGNLARWRAEAGDLPGAIEAGEQLLKDQIRLLGPDHPHMLITRHNIAMWRGHSGDTAGAVSNLARIRLDRERVLGPEHPDTLHTRSELARWRAESGETSQALSELRELLADELRVLGPDHPQTLATRLHLAVVRGLNGAPHLAISELKELLPDLERALGLDHRLVNAAHREAATWQEASESTSTDPPSE
jgi:Tetratricopeptide repeat